MIQDVQIVNQNDKTAITLENVGKVGILAGCSPAVCELTSPLGTRMALIPLKDSILLFDTAKVPSSQIEPESGMVKKPSELDGEIVDAE